ncbi:hypothetical protein PYS58_13600 [Chryseobacterium indologenes]|uniref:hypothetical protein n=1 Tax=Chryseobacterium indologenes TaxID=253 RepID=UPI0023E8C495|nr:hypothetical protein [Chryseobacterium indologenes]WET47613.1 hypothetical protein PYS58_13600 [Chryseobacterium indologenes]
MTINKILKWLLIGITGAVLLYFAISFSAVFILTYFNFSKRIEKIKRDDHIEEIECTPNSEREIKNRDTITYTLYLYSKDFCNIKTDSMKKNSLKIC